MKNPVINLFPIILLLLVTCTAQKVIHAPISKVPQFSTLAYNEFNEAFDGNAPITQIYSYQAMYWTLNLTVGTPPQSFIASIDTGSASLWLPNLTSPLCTSTAESTCNASQIGKPGYYGALDAPKSSSLKLLPDLTQFHQGYFDSSGVNGTWATDTIGFGPGLSVKDVQFGIAQNGSSKFPIMPMYGIGLEALEPKTGAASTGYPSPLRMMKEQGLINCQMFSLYPNGWDGQGGSITFGGVDTTKYTGPLSTVPIISVTGPNKTIDSFWVPWTSLEMGNSSSGESHKISFNNAALLDSGSTQILLPQAISDKIGLPDALTSGQGEILCSDAPQDLYLRLGFNNLAAAEFSIPISKVIAPSRYGNGTARTDKHGNPLCANPFYLLTGQNTNLAVLGSPFVSQLYSVFDVDALQIGLAQPVFNATAEPKYVECGKDSGPGASSAAGGIPGAATQAPTATFRPIGDNPGTTTGASASATASNGAVVAGLPGKAPVLQVVVGLLVAAWGGY